MEWSGVEWSAQVCIAGGRVKCWPYLTAPGSLCPHFQFKEILRKDVIELVLATDMKQVRG